MAILTAADCRRDGDAILEIQRRGALAALKRIGDHARRCGLSHMTMDEFAAEIAAHAE